MTCSVPIITMCKVLKTFRWISISSPRPDFWFVVQSSCKILSSCVCRPSVMTCSVHIITLCKVLKTFRWISISSPRPDFWFVVRIFVFLFLSSCVCRPSVMTCSVQIITMCKVLKTFRWISFSSLRPDFWFVVQISVFVFCFARDSFVGRRPTKEKNRGVSLSFALAPKKSIYQIAACILLSTEIPLTCQSFLH